MSLSRAQQILLKRAQAEAGIADGEYRASLESVTGLPGCSSSKDARLTDGQLDQMLAYFEAIFWRKVDLENWHLRVGGGAFPVFQRRNYWSDKNRRGNTSRDRHVAANLAEQITILETQMTGQGLTIEYLAGIRANIQPFSLINYLAALKRTLNSRSKSAAALLQRG